MAVSYVGTGAMVLSTASIFTPALPTGILPGDLLVMVVTTRETPASSFTLPPGWDSDSSITHGSAGLNSIIVCWKRVDNDNELVPVFTFNAASVTRTICVFALRGVDPVTPVVERLASSNGSQQDIGAITGITVAVGNGLIVIGNKADDWTSVATLSGDGLTWTEVQDNSTTLGNDGGTVIDFTVNDLGSPVAIANKTFAVTGGAVSTGLGYMLEFAAATNPTPEFRTWEANRTRETVTGAGTSDLTLTGTAPDRFVNVRQRFAVLDLFPYLLKDLVTGAWEHGLGRRKTSAVFERVAIYASSNANARVDFAAGDKVLSIPDVASDEVVANMGRFGDGSDGDTTVSGAVSMSRNVHYRFAEFVSGAALVTNGYEFNAHYLDMSAAPAGAISWEGGNGTAAVLNAAGAAGAALSGAIYGGSNIGGAGGAGSTAGGGSGTTAIAMTANNGGNGGNGGGGGAAGGSAGGSGGTGATAALPTVLRNFSGQIGLRALVAIGGGSSGGGGGGGRGSGGITSGGGGGGGSGAGVVVVRAMVAKRSSSSATGSIRARGGSGGAGGNANAGAGARGAGGGGGGAGGGWIVFVAGVVTGTAKTGFFDVSGGNGGAGGTGLNYVSGTATGGVGGIAGQGGCVDIQIAGIMVGSIAPGGSATAPGAASNDTAGTGGVAATWRADL